jgi:hypothetical protein
MKEIFSNKYIQILYDTRTDEASLGWNPQDLTEYEKIIVMKIFCLDEKDNNDAW